MSESTQFEPSFDVPTSLTTSGLYFLGKPIKIDLLESVKQFALSLCGSGDLAFAERVLRDIARGRHRSIVKLDAYFWILRSEVYESLKKLRLAESCFEQAEELKAEPNDILYECWHSFRERHGPMLSVPLMSNADTGSDEDRIDALVTAVLTELSTPEILSDGLVISPTVSDDERVSMMVTSQHSTTEETDPDELFDSGGVSYGRTVSAHTPTAVRYSLLRTTGFTNTTTLSSSSSNTMKSNSSVGGSSSSSVSSSMEEKMDITHVRTSSHGDITLTEVRHYEEEPVEKGTVVDIVSSTAASDSSNPAILRRHKSAYQGSRRELWVADSDTDYGTDSDWQSDHQDEMVMVDEPKSSALKSSLIITDKTDDHDSASHSVSVCHTAEMNTVDIEISVDHISEKGVTIDDQNSTNNSTNNDDTTTLLSPDHGGSLAGSELCSDSIRESESESMYNPSSELTLISDSSGIGAKTSSESSSIDVSAYSSVSSAVSAASASSAVPAPVLKHTNSYIDESLLGSIKESIDRDDESFKMSTLLRRTSVRDQFREEESCTPDVSPSKFTSFASFSTPKSRKKDGRTDLYGDSTWFGE